MSRPAMDYSYLDKTPNKWPRSTARPEFVVWHETASPNPSSPIGTLRYNLRTSVQSSYNYLIARDGTIYHYVDETRWYAYHSGIASMARGYVGGAVNEHSIGVELDGKNDGTPITAAQRDSAVLLMRWFVEAYSIALDRGYHLMHKEVAPTHKTDPRGYSVDALLAFAHATQPIMSNDIQVIGNLPIVTLTQFVSALQRNTAPLSIEEQRRIYTMASWLAIEPSFFIALWAHESGRPLGSSSLQQQTRCPINIKAADGEWRPTVGANGARWLSYESFQLGSMASLLHLKNVHGAVGRVTVRQIIPEHAPASDGNDPDRFIVSVLEDMAYIKAH